MPRFFVESGTPTVGESYTLGGEDARHLAYSLRAKPGEEHILCADGSEYRAVIRAISADEVFFDILSAEHSQAEPDIAVTLYQAFIKNDKFDAVVQKSVELGVSEIVPVVAERCVSKPDGRALAGKIERWQKIARSAAMQSGRAYVPRIGEPVSSEQALTRIAEADCGFLCYEAEPHIPLKQVFAEATEKARRAGKSRAETYAFFIGPEGGVSEKELAAAKAKNVPAASLGKRILRTETAPLCVLSALLFDTDNLN